MARLVCLAWYRVIKPVNFEVAGLWDEVNVHIVEVYQTILKDPEVGAEVNLEVAHLALLNDILVEVALEELEIVPRMLAMQYRSVTALSADDSYEGVKCDALTPN